MNREEFEKWWHGDDTSRHPTNSYEGAMRWAYEGWVRGATAEREACADFLEHGVIDDDGHHEQYAKEIRARGGE
jgi:hypothetical protein